MRFIDNLNCLCGQFFYLYFIVAYKFYTNNLRMLSHFNETDDKLIE